MKKLALLIPLLLNGCVVVPTLDKAYTSRCEISSDRKTLKVMDVAKDTNSYYSISGIILYPITGIVSGAYVAINNVYHFGEETIRCSTDNSPNKSKSDD